MRAGCRWMATRWLDGKQSTFPINHFAFCLFDCRWTADGVFLFEFHIFSVECVCFDSGDGRMFFLAGSLVEKGFLGSRTNSRLFELEPSGSDEGLFGSPSGVSHSHLLAEVNETLTIERKSSDWKYAENSTEPNNDFAFGEIPIQEFRGKSHTKPSFQSKWRNTIVFRHVNSDATTISIWMSKEKTVIRNFHDEPDNNNQIPKRVPFAMNRLVRMNLADDKLWSRAAFDGASMSSMPFKIINIFLLCRHFPTFFRFDIAQFKNHIKICRKQSGEKNLSHRANDDFVFACVLATSQAYFETFGIINEFVRQKC